MLAKFKAYAWQLAAIALGVLLAVQTVRLANAQRDHARAVGVFNAAAAAAERKAREQSETYRAKEQELRNAHDKIERETQAALAAATAGADRAVAAGQRLRRDLADYITAHRERATAAAAANQCAADGPPLICLPNCSDALTSERESWRLSLTPPAPVAPPASAPTMPPVKP